MVSPFPFSEVYHSFCAHPEQESLNTAIDTGERMATSIDERQSSPNHHTHLSLALTLPKC